MTRVLAICLDGFEYSLAEQMIASGDCPAMAALRAQSAEVDLDHGPALRTGLAGEHVATGLSPQGAGRFAAVHFDASTYTAWQEGTVAAPFTNALPGQSVVFDAPYFDLQNAERTLGMVNWGAHDPGVETATRPEGLLSEIIERFGEYPAKRFIYGLPWASVEQSRLMGEQLAEATRIRADICEWLLSERLPDWQLALLTVSEAHSVIEGLWHGVDPHHPLHGATSAGPAGEGVRAVYRNIDQLIGRLAARFSDAQLVVFSMHGMGANGSDAASMLLLAELMYRDQFSKPLFHRKGQGHAQLQGQVPLALDEKWTHWVQQGFTPTPTGWRGLRRRAGARLPASLRSGVRQLLSKPARRSSGSNAAGKTQGRLPLDWLPASRYQPYWSQMRAFALPSYYDGRVRLNLQGREADGKVALADYDSERQRVIDLLRACTDPITGEPVVAAVEAAATADPLQMPPTDADLIFLWNAAPTGFSHPRCGQIGPVPYRRTGGHTGSKGFAWLRTPALAPTHLGQRSAFDVVPTLFSLLQQAPPAHLSGASICP